MPQRQFWTEAHPVEVRLSFTIDATDPLANPQGTFSVLDQSGRIMSWQGGFFPAGFAVYAFSDAVRAGLEAFDVAGPEDATKAFSRARSEWLKAAKDLTTPQR